MGFEKPRILGFLQNPKKVKSPNFRGFFRFFRKSQAEEDEDRMHHQLETFLLLSSEIKL